MRQQALVALLALAAGCGHEQGGEIACSATDRNGTYLVTSTLLGGTCGQLEPTLVQGAQSGAVFTNTSCEQIYGRYSENDCKFESGAACVLPAENMRVAGVAVITQEDEDGDHLTGTMSVTMTVLSTGRTLCTGTYDIDYVRQ